MNLEQLEKDIGLVRQCIDAQIELKNAECRKSVLDRLNEREAGGEPPGDPVSEDAKAACKRLAMFAKQVGHEEAQKLLVSVSRNDWECLGSLEYNDDFSRYYIEKDPRINGYLNDLEHEVWICCDPAAKTSEVQDANCQPEEGSPVDTEAHVRDGLEAQPEAELSKAEAGSKGELESQLKTIVSVLPPNVVRRRQRLEFIGPRRRAGETWPQISKAYLQEFPKDPWSKTQDKPGAVRRFWDRYRDC